jgi:hypothetical protein
VKRNSFDFVRSWIVRSLDDLDQEGVGILSHNKLTGRTRRKLDRGLPYFVSCPVVPRSLPAPAYHWRSAEDVGDGSRGH